MKARFLILAALLPLPMLGQISQPAVVQTATTPTTCSNFFWALTTTSPWTIYAPTASLACQALGTGTGTGTVTSVALVGSGGLFSTTPGTAVTSAGNLNLDSQLATQTANCVVAGPATGSAATPTCRALVSADIPNNAANTTGSAGSTTAALTMNNSGTGATSGSTFNGSAAETISYNTVGAAPAVAASTVRGYCTGTATSSTTLYLFQLGTGATTCTGTSSVGYDAFLATHAGTLKNLTVKVGSAGVSTSSGVFSISDEGVTNTNITCTIGTGTTCSDTTHTYTTTAGHYYFVQFTTQASETLANVQVSFDFQ
jgi:hypothetical protein